MRYALPIALAAAALALAAPTIANKLAHHKNVFKLEDKNIHHVVDDGPKLMFCKDGNRTFAVDPRHVYLVIRDPAPSSEVEHGVVGIPVAVLMVDLEHIGHLYTNKMPVCSKSDRADS